MISVETCHGKSLLAMASLYERGIMLIVPDWTMVFFALSFLIFIFLLNLTLFKPVGKIIEKRKSLIDTEYAKAKESNKLGNEMLEDHKEKIKEAHHEASIITNQAVRDSERIKSEKIHALSINLQKEKEQALKKIKEEEKIAQKELEGKIKTLVDLIMTKIIRQEKDLVRT